MTPALILKSTWLTLHFYERPTFSQGTVKGQLNVILLKSIIYPAFETFTVLLLYHFSLIHSGFDSERKSFLMFEHVFDVTCYCAFHKHANFEVQKPTDDWVLSLPSIILTELLGNKILLSQVQKGHGLWFAIGGFRRFVACDRNYDWGQQKT